MNDKEKGSSFTQERRGRRPSLGYYNIITDTEKTEKQYFESLRDSLTLEMRRKLAITVTNTPTDKLLETAIQEKIWIRSYGVFGLSLTGMKL